MAVLSKDQIAALSPQERLSLIDALWESLEAPALPASMEAAHRRVIEERLAEYDASTAELASLDDVCGRLQAR